MHCPHGCAALVDALPSSGATRASLFHVSGPSGFAASNEKRHRVANPRASLSRPHRIAGQRIPPKTSPPTAHFVPPAWRVQT